MKIDRNYNNRQMTVFGYFFFGFQMRRKHEKKKKTICSEAKRCEQL